MKWYEIFVIVKYGIQISRSIELIKLRDQCLTPKHVNQYMLMTFTCLQHVSKDAKKSYTIEDTSNLNSPVGDGFHLFEIVLFYASLNHLKGLITAPVLIKVMRRMRDVLYPPTDTILTPEEERFTNEVMEAFFVPQRTYMREVKKRIISLVRNPPASDQVEAGSRLLTAAIKDKVRDASRFMSSRNLSYFMMHYLEGGFLFESPGQAISALLSLISYFDQFSQTPGRLSKTVWIEHLITLMRKSILAVEICYFRAKHKNIKVRNFEHHVCKAGPPSPIAGRIVAAASITPSASSVKPSSAAMIPLSVRPSLVEETAERGRPLTMLTGPYGSGVNRSVSLGASVQKNERNIFAHSLLSFTDTFKQPSFDVSQPTVPSPRVIRDQVEPYELDGLQQKSPRTPRTVPLVSEFFAAAGGIGRAAVPVLFDSVLRIPPRQEARSRSVTPPRLGVILSPPQSLAPHAFPSSVIKGMPFKAESPPRSPLRHPGRLTSLSAKDRRGEESDSLGVGFSRRMSSPGLPVRHSTAASGGVFESLEKTRDLVYKSLVQAGMSPERSSRVASQFTEGPDDVAALKRAVVAPPRPTSPVDRLDSLMQRAEAAVNDTHKLREIKAIMAEIRDIAKSQ